MPAVEAGAVGRGPLGKTTGIITLAILIGATSWAVASLSTWLVPVYVTGMVLIFALPRPQPAGSREPLNQAGKPGDRTQPGAGDRPGGSNEPGSAPVKGKGGAGAKARRSPVAGAAPPADLENANDPAEASAQPAELPTPTAKPRKPRSRARKTAKAGPRPELESTPGTGATWIRVGPGKFIRADTQEPSTTSTAEPPGATEVVREAGSTVDATAQPAVASEPLPSGEAVAATSPSPAEEIIESETSHDGPISSVNSLVVPDAPSITACVSTAEDPELPPPPSSQEESDASLSLPEEEASPSPLAEEEVREDSEESAEQGPGQDLVPSTSGTIEETTAPADSSEPGFDDGPSGTGADPLDPADLEVAGTPAEEYGIAPSAFDDDPLAGRPDPEDVSTAQLEVSVSTDAFMLGPPDAPSASPTAASPGAATDRLEARRTTPSSGRPGTGTLSASRLSGCLPSRASHRRGRWLRLRSDDVRVAVRSRGPVHPGGLRPRRNAGRPDPLPRGFHNRSPPSGR